LVYQQISSLRPRKSDYWNKKIAKAYKRLSEVTLDQEKMQIRFDVEKAFDQVIYLDSAVAIYEASIEQAKSI
jgi:OMF family outer membrane factor